MKRCNTFIFVWVLVLGCGGNLLSQIEKRSGQELPKTMQRTLGRPDKIPTERDVKALQTLLKKQKQVLIGVTVGCLGLLVGAGLYMRRLVRRDRERQKETDAFLRAQLDAYDEKILRMLIVNAGYEEIKARLKKEFNIDNF